MVIVFEKDRTVILNKDGSIKKVVSISEEAFIEEDLICEKKIENNFSIINEENKANVI